MARHQKNKTKSEKNTNHDSEGSTVKSKISEKLPISLESKMSSEEMKVTKKVIGHELLDDKCSPNDGNYDSNDDIFDVHSNDQSVPMTFERNSNRQISLFDYWFNDNWMTITQIEKKITQKQLKHMEELCNSDVAYTIGKEMVTGMDIKNILCNNWLNDNVINFFLKGCFWLRGLHIINKNSTENDIFFRTNFIQSVIESDYNTIKRKFVEIYRKKLIKDGNIINVNRIFIPANIRNTHWVLFVMDIKNKTIEFYDSLSKNFKKEIEVLTSALKGVSNMFFDKSSLDEENKKNNGVH